MYGWIHTCLEKLILTRFGEDTWQNIKTEAQCPFKNGDWIRYDNYSDAQIYSLLDASCKILSLDMDTLLEIYGGYFMDYVREEGYLNMLTMVGSTFREWLNNANDLHTHMKTSLVDAKFPEFWCTDDDEEDGVHESMIFHYFSHRGSILSPIVVGVVKDVAAYFFKQKIEMKKIAVQDVDESPYTTWRVTILGPLDAPAADPTADAIKKDIGSAPSVGSSGVNPPPGCPFHK